MTDSDRFKKNTHSWVFLWKQITLVLGLLHLPFISSKGHLCMCLYACVLRCPLTRLLAPVRIRCVWSIRSRRARRWPGQRWPEQEVPSPRGSRASIDALCARHSWPALARSSPPGDKVWENNLCTGMWTEKKQNLRQHKQHLHEPHYLRCEERQNVWTFGGFFFIILCLWGHLVFVVSEVLNHRHTRQHFYHTHNSHVCFVISQALIVSYISHTKPCIVT